MDEPKEILVQLMSVPVEKEEFDEEDNDESDR